MAKRRRQRRGPFDFAHKRSFQLFFLLSTIFLYAPIIVLIIFSFNNSRRGGNVVWRGFTTRYYELAANNASLIEAFTNSLTIAVITTLFSVILGALTAVVLWRFRFPLKPGYEGLVALPIVIPEICLGVAIAAFFASAGLYVPQGTPWPFNLTKYHHRPYHLCLSVCRHGDPNAAGLLQPRDGGGRKGPGRHGISGVQGHPAAAYAARADRGRPSGLHPVAG